MLPLGFAPEYTYLSLGLAKIGKRACVLLLAASGVSFTEPIYDAAALLR